MGIGRQADLDRAEGDWFVANGGNSAVDAPADLGRDDPQTVHGAESGLLMASIIFLASHLFVLKQAARANPTA
jgi:hypothetical protein